MGMSGGPHFSPDWAVWAVVLVLVFLVCEGLARLGV